MFIVLLDAVRAAQQAKQIAPNVYVTVEQAPRMPEWVNILISAGVGAVLGIAGNVVMEFVKPILARRRAARQLSVELVNRLSMVVAADQLLKENVFADLKRRHSVANVIITTLKRNRLERYAYFTGSQQSVVYEIPKFEKLRSFDNFYNFAQPPKDDPFLALRLDLDLMIESAEGFLAEHYPKYSLDVKNDRDLYELELSVEKVSPFDK